jgi:endogenous inhibitor of DNA gyrase (YacG/DUF329 family)
VKEVLTNQAEATEAPSRNDSETIRTCPSCGVDFVASGRRRHCSDRCRQAAWRRRYGPAVPEPPVPPKGLKRAVTVYVCDVRALGEQYCPECRTFRRAVGLGGPCPACDEPIALSELSEAVIGASMV